MWKAPSMMVAIVLVLIALGVVILYSTSSVKAGDQYQDPNHFLKRQLMWLAIAITGCVISATVIDYHFWKKKWVWISLAALSASLLAMVFIPGVGLRIGGASRWLKIGGFRIGQPSELAKFTVVMLLATWMSYAGRKAIKFKEGIFIPLSFMSVFLALIVIEPDYGTTMLVGTVGLAVMFAGGARFAYLLIVTAIGAGGFFLAIMQNAERMRRFFAFLNPNTFPDEAYQLKQSVDAFILGGGLGVGLGRSLQKHSYLPEAHTDFILAIVGEELGVAATVLVVIMFAGFMICGMTIAIRAVDPFGRLVAFGLTTLIVLQAAINVGVVTGCLPTKGLPLPFISNGGSNLIMCLFSVGVLLNIARHTSGDAPDKHTKTFKDSVHDA